VLNSTNSSTVGNCKLFV